MYFIDLISEILSDLITNICGRYKLTYAFNFCYFMLVY